MARAAACTSLTVVSVIAASAGLTSRSLGIEYDRRSPDARRDLLEHFEPLSDHRWRKISEAGRAAARSRDARHKVAAYWIGHAHEHDWNGARLVQQRRCGGS